MRSIVIGYDGSESAGRALERAAELADDGAAVTVVSSTHALAGKGGFAYDPAEKEAHREHLLEARARLEAHGVEPAVVEGFGDPAEAIVRQAAESDADLIVVGNEHRNLIERLLEGSVSSGVTHRAECDVLVVR